MTASDLNLDFPPNKPPRRLVAQLLKDISSTDNVRYKRAMEVLKLFGPRSTEMLRAMLRRSILDAKQKRWIRIVGGCLCTSWIAAKLMAGAPLTLDRDLTGVTYAFLGLAWLIMGETYSRRVLAEIIATVSEIEDRRILIPLLETALTHSLFDLAGNPAIRALNRIKASDADRVDDEIRSFMRTALGSRHPELVKATLGAAEQLGDPKFLPMVEWLARGEGAAKSSPSIEEAAETCAKSLLAAAAKEKVSGKLLRPAEAPGVDEAALLRPAAGQTEADTAALLRPST